MIQNSQLFRPPYASIRSTIEIVQTLNMTYSVQRQYVNLPVIVAFRPPNRDPGLHPHGKKEAHER